MTEVTGRQLDKCDICGKKVHKIDLVRTNVDFLSPSGNNYFDYSSYNSSFWSLLNGTDAGVVSIGPYADRARISISDDNTRTEILGSQTWTVSTPVGDYQGIVRIRSGSIDVSDWTSMVVAFDWGYHQQEEVQDATAYAYLYDADDVNGNITRKYMRGTSGPYWVKFDISDIDSSADLTRMTVIIVVGTYSGGEKIWIDRLRLEKDVSKMGTFIPTSGSSVDQIDTRAMTMRKVCKSCYEPITSRTNQYNREPEQRTDEPISVWMQEA